MNHTGFRQGGAILLALFLGLIFVHCGYESEEEAAGGWFHTRGNRILTGSGETWQGRGANIHDTRSCNACTWFAPDLAEVKRRIDKLVDGWKANFIRLCLESYANSAGRVHWRNLLEDSSYLDNIKEIVRYTGTKENVMVLLSLWHDPSFTSLGWPTSETIRTWERLAVEFLNDRHVIYGLVNEPQHNYDGALNQQCWQALNDTVAAIREVERKNGGNNHLIAVQGLGGWARFLQYYLDHPITAGDGKNIVYEVHVYNPARDFPTLVTSPAEKLPVIIGEFGPAQGYMTLNECRDLLELAESLKVPYLAWTFHMRCPPNLLVDHSNGGCGAGMPLEPTEWGKLLQEFLSRNEHSR